MPIELKITVDDPTEMTAIIASLHGQLAGGDAEPAKASKSDENPEPKKRAAKTKAKAEPKADEGAKDEPAVEAEAVAEKTEEPAADEAESKAPPSIDDLRKAIANAIDKLSGGQADVLKIMEKFTPEGEKVSASTVAEGDRAELIHMLNSKAEGA